jgi:hypothetical protein
MGCAVSVEAMSNKYPVWLRSPNGAASHRRLRHALAINVVRTKAPTVKIDAAASSVNASKKQLRLPWKAGTRPNNKQQMKSQNPDQTKGPGGKS